eukprot:TRINITY_DN8827_c0_g1_i1.p1 TRINITY_DN8827_c0_g1~~TRINITY_DN8827_c0_g1_i1.p1  ORF type:complete len:197 (-),score=43.71 TRINITY_DN8827_c0_g1_i1:202-792(-)
MASSLDDSGGDVHVCAAFNVATGQLPGYCEAINRVMAHARAEDGCKQFELQRELNWSQKVSNEERTLFMVRQRWSSSEALEAHVKSSHAQSFDESLRDGDMLVCQPSLTLFGPALSGSELQKIIGECRAEQGAAGATTKMVKRPPRARGGYNESGSSTTAAARPASRDSHTSAATRTKSLGGSGTLRQGSRGPAWK